MCCSGAQRSHLTHTEAKRRYPEEVGVQRAGRSSGWVPGRVSRREGSDETREVIMEEPQWLLSLSVTDPTNTMDGSYAGC